MQITNAIDVHWEELNKKIDDVFAERKIKVTKIK